MMHVCAATPGFLTSRASADGVFDWRYRGSDEVFQFFTVGLLLVNMRAGNNGDNPWCQSNI